MQSKLEESKNDIDMRINNNDLIYIEVGYENDIVACKCYFQELTKYGRNRDEEQIQKSDSMIEFENIIKKYNSSSGAELLTNTSYRLVLVSYFNEVGSIYKRKYYSMSGELFAEDYISGCNEVTVYYDRDGNIRSEKVAPIVVPLPVGYPIISGCI